MPRKPFKRHLDAHFVQFLKQPIGARLLALFRTYQLDVRLRGTALNAYYRGRSVGQVRWLSRTKRANVAIHRKYLVGTPFLDGQKSTYPSFGLNESNLALYESHLDRIKANSEEYLGKEEVWEEGVVRANTTGTPLLVIDRQVAETRNRRADLVCLYDHGGETALVAVELKQSLDNRIKKVAEQVHAYVEVLAPKDGLAKGIAESYREVCNQMRELGLAAPDPAKVKPGMPVLGLVALADYNFRSKLLPMARSAARALKNPTYFCEIRGTELRLPARPWETFAQKT